MVAARLAKEKQAEELSETEIQEHADRQAELRQKHGVPQPSPSVSASWEAAIAKVKGETIR